MPDNPKCKNPDCKDEPMVRSNVQGAQKSTQWQFRCPKCGQTQFVSDPPFTTFKTPN